MTHQEVVYKAICNLLDGKTILSSSKLCIGSWSELELVDHILLCGLVGHQMTSQDQMLQGELQQFPLAVCFASNA